MSRKLKVLLSVVAMSFVMVGCGGGGSSSDNPSAPAVDNSGNLENQYGYFGNEVVLGNTLAVGSWTVRAEYNGAIETVSVIMYADGRQTFTNLGNGLSFDADYGISQNGTTMKNSRGDTEFIQSSLGNNCYTILMTNINKAGSLTGELCRTGDIL